MSMRDFFRGDRDRHPWREDMRGENRYGQQDSERHSQERWGQGRDWGRGRQWGRDQNQDNERESGRYGSYAGGADNPQFYGQSGRSDWRESDYGREYESQGGRRGWDEQRDWGERNHGDRVRGSEYGGYSTDRHGSTEYGNRRGSGGQHGSEGGGDLYREREYGGAGGARFAPSRVGHAGSGSISSQTGAGLTGMFRGKGPRGYQRSDDRIREEVCECLTDDPLIDASNLEVTVKNCEVTLSGTVSSREEKRRAADIIEDLSGVKDVHNNLRVAAEQSSGTQQGSTQQATGTQAGQTTPRH